MIRLVQLGVDHPHAAAYRETLWLLRDRIEVVGFLGRPDRAVEIGAPFANVPVFDSLDDLLNAVKPDAAQVMLRNNEMGAALATLAGEGIHLWAEKPVALSSADLSPVAETVRAKNLIFTAGYQSRFYPTVRYVRRLIREGLLGPLTFAHMTTLTTTVRLRNPGGPNGFLFDPAVSGGGIFHWLGCHMVDVLLAVANSRPVVVTAFTATAGAEPVPVEDIASVTIRFAEGWLASLNYGYLLPTKTASPFGDDSPEPAIYGQQGWVRWNTGSDFARAYSNDPRWQDSPWQLRQFSSPHEDGYGYAARLAMENFCNAIAGTGQPEYTIDQARLVLQIIEAAYTSAKSGGTSEIPNEVSSAFI